MVGVVKFFLNKKGWGFITSNSDGQEYLAHYTEIISIGDPVFRKLKKDQSVEFDTKQTPNGIRAINIKPIN